jgi:protein-tyrosine phosphatase
MSTRRIDFEGPVNFRDLGGYATGDGQRVRWGRLYRSDSLHTITTADLPRLRELGVRTAIDFRSSDEITRLGIGPIGEVPVAHVHVPTFDRAQGDRAQTDEAPFIGETAADFYAHMLDRGGGAYVAAVEAIADADALPAVFFCLAGKDRTGCFAALVLGVLGVPDDTIVADYALTQEIVPLLTERRLQRDGIAAEAARWKHIPDDLREAPPRTMAALVERVEERWGGWVGYAEAVGVTPDTIGRLREHLLEDDTP